MFSYELICYSCKRTFHVYEGSTLYKLVKERKGTKFTCEDCHHKARLEAIKRFMN
nr:DUF2197 domain-containing protein [Geomicrobium sediminis]